VNAKRLRDAGSKSIGLNQHGDQRSDILYLRSRGKVLERLESRLAGAAFHVDQSQFLGERRMSDRQFLGALQESLVERKPGFKRHDQQVERVGKAVLDLLLTPLDSAVQDEAWEEVPDKTAEQRVQFSALHPKIRIGMSTPSTPPTISDSA
jgi:hypothetical protein